MILKSLIRLVAVLVLIGAAHAQPSTKLGLRIASAARLQIGVTTEYDSSYASLKYPGGDVAIHTGVCTDVVVRALRQIGMDLQKEIHEDMLRNFGKYPKKWGLKKTDKNIDHRRVPNLMRFFERRQIAMEEKLRVPETYRAGDIVAWDLGSGVLHIGIVSDKTTGSTPLIIHNIGADANEEDILLKYKIIGHYRIKEGAQ